MFLIDALLSADSDSIAKIAAANGMDSSTNTEDLRDELLTFPVINEIVMQSHAPGFSILREIIGSENCCVNVENLKPRVLGEWNSIREKVLPKKASKHSDLYAKILYEARLSERRIDESEENILAALRRELGLPTSEHYIIQYSDSFKYFWEDFDRSFDRELVYFRDHGLVYSRGHELLIPLDLKNLVRESLGFDLSKEGMHLVLGKLSLGEIQEIEESVGYRSYAQKEERIETLVSCAISVRDQLKVLSNERLREVAESLKEPTSGTKETLIDRIVSSVDTGRHLKDHTPTEPEAEERLLNHDEFRAMFSLLKGHDLQQILRSIPHAKRKTGDKPSLIDSLWQVQLSEQSLLKKLRNDSLKEILLSQNLPVAGSKDTRILRLVELGRSLPSQTAIAETEPQQELAVLMVAPLAANGG